MVNETVGIYKDRGSKFLAYAFPMESKEVFDIKLDSIKKEHPKARHFCYAFIEGLTEGGFRYNDDGEPGGSAGLPIYNQLLSANLVETAVVVVRYFGGKKLGVPGLIKAYKSATKDALNQGKIQKKYLLKFYKITFQYEQTGLVMRVLNDSSSSILENGYADSPFILLSIRLSQADILKRKLLGMLLKRELNDIIGDESVNGFSIEEQQI